MDVSLAAALGVDASLKGQLRKLVAQQCVLIRSAVGLLPGLATQPSQTTLAALLASSSGAAPAEVPVRLLCVPHSVALLSAGYPLPSQRLTLPGPSPSEP